MKAEELRERAAHAEHTEPETPELIEEGLIPPNSEIRATDPDTGGQKNRRLERYGLIPVEPLAEVARVYGIGAQKYTDDNWRKGYPYSWSYDALQRHVNRFWAGESEDPETGLHPLAHAAWHCFTLMFYDMLGIGKDDRHD